MTELYLTFFFYLIIFYAIKIKNSVIYLNKKIFIYYWLNNHSFKSTKLKSINFEWLYTFYSLFFLIHGPNYHYNSRFDSKYNASFESIQDGNKVLLMNTFKNCPKK
jgi:hypothetical protein